MNDDEPIKYRKNFMKLSFEPDDDLPLGKTFSISNMIIDAASVLENGKYYGKYYLDICSNKCAYVLEKDGKHQQVFLHKCAYVMMF